MIPFDLKRAFLFMKYPAKEANTDENTIRQAQTVYDVLRHIVVLVDTEIARGYKDTIETVNPVTRYLAAISAITDIEQLVAMGLHLHTMLIKVSDKETPSPHQMD